MRHTKKRPNTAYRRRRFVVSEDLTTAIYLRHETKLNWFGKICLVLGPLILIASLVCFLWVPTLFGLPTFVVGAALCLIVLGVATLNSRAHIST